MAVGVMQRLEDLNTVLGQTNDHRHRVLVAAAKNIKVWFVKVRKIKAIYYTLNFFNLDTSQKCLIAECWIPGWTWRPFSWLSGEEQRSRAPRWRRS